VELFRHLLCSDVKGIKSWSIVTYDLLNISAFSISVLAIFATRSRRISLGDVTTHGPRLTKPRTAWD